MQLHCCELGRNLLPLSVSKDLVVQSCLLAHHVLVSLAHMLVQVQLKGHRSVGGMRASIYNSMPLDGIHQLVDFMKEFKATHQQAHWTQPM